MLALLGYKPSSALLSDTSTAENIPHNPEYFSIEKLILFPTAGDNICNFPHPFHFFALAQ
jgi:hypothetical protein